MSARVVEAEEAQRRATADYSQYADYSRLAAQLTFAANGGSALAMLSFITALLSADPSVTPPSLSLEKVINGFAIATGAYLRLRTHKRH